MNAKYVKAAIQLTDDWTATAVQKIAEKLSKQLGFSVSKNQAVAHAVKKLIESDETLRKAMDNAHGREE